MEEPGDPPCTAHRDQERGTPGGTERGHKDCLGRGNGVNLSRVVSSELFPDGGRGSRGYLDGSVQGPCRTMREGTVQRLSCHPLSLGDP